MNHQVLLFWLCCLAGMFLAGIISDLIDEVREHTTRREASYDAPWADREPGDLQ